jgi:titin
VPAAPTNKSEAVAVLPALTPNIRQISSDPVAKTVVLQVANYQPGFTWAFNTYSTIKASIDSAGYITLSGVNGCGYSAVFIAANRPGYLTGTANPEYEMKCVKLAAPTFSSIKSSTNGFTVQVTNYDPSLRYQLALASNSNASLSMNSSGLITATGISSSSYDTLISLYVSKDGFYSNQAEVRGFAVDVVYEPVLGAIYPTANGIGFRITNFDPQFTWYTTITGELPGRANLDYSSGTVSVTPLRAGESVQLELAASKSGNYVFRKYIQLTGPAAVTQPALSPTFAPTASQASGFTAQVSNYNSFYSWSVSASAGTASISSTGLITVSGLSAGQTASVTVRTARTGYSSGASSVSGQAATAAVASTQPALTPTFGIPTSQATGFTAQVSNYSPAYSWSVSSSAGSAAISTTGLITVSGLSAGQSATITANTVRTGYSSGSATFSGQATAAVVVTLQPALTPAHATPASQATGFTTQVSNYNSAYTWSVSSSAGSASISSTGLITVSGLSAGQSATVTTRTARTGYTSGAATVTGQATAAPNQPALVPTFNTPTKTSGGFYASITNYSSSHQWSASTTAGSVAINSSGQVTVTGLTQGQSATVTVRNTRAGYDAGSSSLTSSAIVTSLTPAFGALSSAINGFWIVITNYDPTFTWTITSSQGRPSVFTNGNLGVADIGRNTSVKVTVTATKNGISSSASTVGSSN